MQKLTLIDLEDFIWDKVEVIDTKAIVFSNKEDDDDYVLFFDGKDRECYVSLIEECFGEVEDLVGVQLIKARQKYLLIEKNKFGRSHTWHFLRFLTEKGVVQIIWYVSTERKCLENLTLEEVKKEDIDSFIKTLKQSRNSDKLYSSKMLKTKKP